MFGIKEVRADVDRLDAALGREVRSTPSVVRLRALAKGVAGGLTSLQRADPRLSRAIDEAKGVVAAVDPAEHVSKVAALAAIDTARRLAMAGDGAARAYSFGWRRDIPDARDQIYSAPLSALQALPPAVDLRPLMPAVYDQGRLNSCTANAIAAAVQFARRKAGEKPDFVPSRLMIYYNERTKEHSAPLDAGARLRDGIKSIASLGVCPEAAWPYDSVVADPRTTLFSAGARAATPPDANAAALALDHVAISYHSIVPSLSQLKGCLAEGYPFVFGFIVYGSFYDETGRPKAHVDLPSPGDDFKGGHAVTAVGYDDVRKVFILRNSWGGAVQDQGHFDMPYAYLTDASMAGDFWTIRAVKS